MELTEAKKLNGVVTTLVPGSTPQACKRQPERVGARGAAHAGAHTQVLRRLALEAVNFWAADEVLRRQHALDRGIALRP